MGQIMGDKEQMGAGGGGQRQEDWLGTEKEKHLGW